MYYVYLLVNEHNEKYIGYTSDLRRRVKEHQEGRSPYTSQRGKEWRLVYYEAYPKEEMARKREAILKRNGSMRKHLYRRFELL